MENRKSIEALENLVQELDAKLASYESVDLESLSDDLTEYQELGSPEEIQDLIEKYREAKESLRIYENLGTPEEIHALVEAFNDVQEQLEGCEQELSQYHELGTIDEVESLCESYRRLNRRLDESEAEVEDLQDELDDAIQTANDDLDEAEADVNELEAELESYRRLGSPHQINKVFEAMDDMMADQEEQAEAQESYQLDAPQGVRSVDESYTEASDNMSSGMLKLRNTLMTI